MGKKAIHSFVYVCFAEKIYFFAAIAVGEVIECFASGIQ